MRLAVYDIFHYPVCTSAVERLGCNEYTHVGGVLHVHAHVHVACMVLTLILYHGRCNIASGGM